VWNAQYPVLANGFLVTGAANWQQFIFFGHFHHNKNRITKTMKLTKTIQGVSGDTLIQTGEGIRQISSLFSLPDQGEDNEYRPLQPTNLYFGRSSDLPVEHLYYAIPMPTIRVTTKAGKTITGDHTHSVLTLSPETKKVEYTPLSKITIGHHLIGGVSSSPVTKHPHLPPSPCGLMRHLHTQTYMSYSEFLSGSYINQMIYVASLVVRDGLTPKVRPSIYAQTFAAVAAMMGCYSRISHLPGESTYLVSLFPLVKNSILSQLVGTILCPYSPTLAKECRGEAQNISDYYRACDPPLSLKQFKKNSLYADQVDSVAVVDSVHAFIGDGYIRRGPAAPAANWQQFIFFDHFHHHKNRITKIMTTPYSTAQNIATAHRPQSFKDVIGQETPKAALRAIAKSPATSFHSIALAGPYGTGKCVSGDTLVQSPNGIRQIRSLFPIIKGEDIVRRQVRFDLQPPLPLHFGSTTLPVSYLYYSGVKPTVKITTSTGKTLIGSYRHPVLTLNPETKRVEYIPLSKITGNHFLIGVVTNTHPTPDRLSLDDDRIKFLPLPYLGFLSLSYEDQMLYVAALVRDERSLSLKLPFHSFAQAVAAVAAVMGCYSRIETVPPTSLDMDETYVVHLVPLMKDSILSQLVGPVLCPYDPCLASIRAWDFSREADINYGYTLSEEASEALSLVVKPGCALYADLIVSVEAGDSIPLYDPHVPEVHAFIGEGYP
jgi:hypothetical protein